MAYNKKINEIMKLIFITCLFTYYFLVNGIIYIMHYALCIIIYYAQELYNILLRNIIRIEKITEFWLFIKLLEGTQQDVEEFGGMLLYSLDEIWKGTSHDRAIRNIFSLVYSIFYRLKLQHLQ